MIEILIKKTIDKNHSTVYLIEHKKQVEKLPLIKKEIDYVLSQIDQNNNMVIINRFTEYILIFFNKAEDKQELHVLKEKYRTAGYNINIEINKLKLTTVNICGVLSEPELQYAFVEGLVLSNYSFTKYLSSPEKKSKSLHSVIIAEGTITKKQVDELCVITSSVKLVKDLVNEPNNKLNAEKLANEIMKTGLECGFKTEVFDLEKIKKLGMGGLLAVNKGSIDPPTFSVLEWKPERAKNKKPVVLVGKGVVFDTGGINLKQGKSLKHMHSDMAGAASVLGILSLISKIKLPVYVIGLIPATDNRPGLNAYVPQDIITMYNKKTVEITNTDAEGRLILADAISYAGNFNPSLVISIATLTGSARATIGHHGIICLTNADKKVINNLSLSGMNVRERIVELPFWDEYLDLLKSDIADIKNSGGSFAGAITAGKFLAQFTDFPFIHLDIAGMAYLDKTLNYKGKGPSGVPVRLIFDFLKHLY